MPVTAAAATAPAGAAEEGKKGDEAMTEKEAREEEEVRVS